MLLETDIQRKATPAPNLVPSHILHRQGAGGPGTLRYKTILPLNFFLFYIIHTDIVFEHLGLHTRPVGIILNSSPCI